MGRDPALLLAYVEQHAVDALLRGGAGVEVVGEDLVQVRQAVVDDDLLAAEVRVPEGRRDVDHRAGLEVVHRADVHKGLELGHGEAEEGRVARADQHGLVAVVVAAGLEGHEYELLLRQPAERLYPELVELVAVDVLKAGLVGGLVVGDAHTVGVAAAHVVLGVVDGGAVLAADDLRLLDGLAVDVVQHLDLARMLIAEYQLEEDLLAGGDDDARAVVDDPAQLLGERETLEKYVHCLPHFPRRDGGETAQTH